MGVEISYQMGFVMENVNPVAEKFVLGKEVMLIL